MADYEEQLSDEEKVKSLISPRRLPRRRTFALAFAATLDRVRRRNRAAAEVGNLEEKPGRGSATAAALIIFSSTSALCEPPPKAPSTVLTQNRRRVPVINSHKFPRRPIFALVDMSRLSGASATACFKVLPHQTPMATYLA